MTEFDTKYQVLSEMVGDVVNRLRKIEADAALTLHWFGNPLTQDKAPIEEAMKKMERILAHPNLRIPETVFAPLLVRFYSEDDARHLFLADLTTDNYCRQCRQSLMRKAQSPSSPESDCGTDSDKPLAKCPDFQDGRGFQDKRL